MAALNSGKNCAHWSLICEVVQEYESWSIWNPNTSNNDVWLGDRVEGLKRESEINRYNKGAIFSKSVLGCKTMIMQWK